MSGSARRITTFAAAILGSLIGALAIWSRLPPSPATAAPAGIAAPAGAPAASGYQGAAAVHLRPQDERFLDQLEERTFRWFWDLANPANGLVPDRAPSPSFSSIAAVGFGLTAYPIGVERGWVSRAQARARVLATLRFLLAAPQGPAASGVTSYHGFFYHFLDMQTGLRYKDVELSPIDTALLMAGVLFDESYFDRAAGLPDDPRGDEAAIRAAAEELYTRVDWRWMQPHPPDVALGWTPESGYIPYQWRGYNEAVILYLLALGSPTHAVDEEAWRRYTSTYLWGTYYGQEYLAFTPLFGYQYPHTWVDFRGIRDAFMRAHASDYFETARRATLAQRAYAVANPEAFRGYGPEVWGLTACDGPGDMTFEADGRTRTFHGYWARGASLAAVRDDGTLAPTAAASAIAVAPEIAVPAMTEMARLDGGRLFTAYGFVDAWNPTFRPARSVATGDRRSRLRWSPVATLVASRSRDRPAAAGQANPHRRVERGVVDPQLGWFDTDALGIDQGPIVAMIENFRSGLVWRFMRHNPHLVQGLRRAGFEGGWLAAAEMPAPRQESRH
ncbi:MAG: Tat pathway signal protein [Acidobacteria bacterium]|nr:Tat pathway signal protein [Acidobacteriota bacterium]